MSKRGEISSSPLSRAAHGEIGAARRPDPQKVERLETEKAENSSVQKLGSLELQKSRNPEPRGPGRPKSQGPERVGRTIYLPPDLARWLKVYAAMHDREISEIVTDVLEGYRRDRTRLGESY